jgi:DNA-binding MarR family transcriptional regulator
MGRSILDDSLGYQLGVTYRKMLHPLMQRFKPYDLTPEQFTVLVRLYEEDGINQKELALRTSRDQPTLTRILDLLERKGMVRKETDPSDRRAFLLYVTEEGQKITEILTPIEQQYNRELFAGMNREDIEKFRQNLELLLENAERLSE